MAPSEKRWKRLIVRWTAPKGLLAIVLFLFIALLFEYLMVLSFQIMGLTDKNVWAITFQIPIINWFFTITISPLFHIVPLAVLVVLLSSWAYLTKYTALMPQQIVQTKKVSMPIRRGQEKRRFKALRGLSKTISRRLQRVGRAVKAWIWRIKGISYISQQLFCAKAAIESALTVLLIFFCISILIIIVEYPTLIHDLIVTYYRENPSSRDFVLGTIEFARSIGQTVAPLGGLASAINNALIGIAPGFRKTLEGTGASLTRPIVNLDVVGKYLVTQNLAAWISALSALAYGAYVSSRPYRRAKGK